ncbi:MAG: hypothetical protein KGL70_10920 [Betaproteobacteria bacterium]|nr:hypothetical protein [Betaproteobacteria bacterium]MDE2002135.1 hypothetical protein [Betaproteobacteria bacterium]MDE2209564.1 hypothetical protein [Betaproteobacteria bacterium]MDE2359884.1 hypothetical protein [Betaproteobacteria bacterium]
MAAATSALPARADPDDYVSVPAVEYGERELELRLGTATQGGAERSSAGSLAFGYGATQWWFTEVYAKFNRFGGASTHFDAIEWENKFELAEPGEYPVDLGVLVEVERPQDRAGGYELRLGPLLQKGFGPVQANANLFLQRHYRASGPAATELAYQWQLKYRWREAFEFGAQGFGGVGQWDRWDPGHEQRHVLGPAVFGKLRLGGRKALVWNAAYLIKASSAAPDRTLRAQVEYEF